MRKFFMIPTWVMVNAMSPILPKNHIWKNKHFTLSEWTKNATDFNFWLSFMMWYSLVNIVVFLIIINK